jgi:hypothetical protein
VPSTPISILVDQLNSGGALASTRVGTTWGKRAEVPGCLVKSRDQYKCRQHGARCLTTLGSRPPELACGSGPDVTKQAHGDGSTRWPQPETEAGLAERSSACGSLEARPDRRLRP